MTRIRDQLIVDITLWGEKTLDFYGFEADYDDLRAVSPDDLDDAIDRLLAPEMEKARVAIKRTILEGAAP